MNNRCTDTDTIGRNSYVTNSFTFLLLSMLPVITGIRHGLFPAEDDRLPYGWTWQMAGAIESYFDQYNQKKTEDEKIKFAAARKRAGEDEVAGHPLF